MIDNILITELGFRTTTHDRCIYIQERDGKIQLLLRQVNDFILRIISKKAAWDSFHDIGVKIQFPSKVEANIIPFKFLGVVKNYDGVDIIQMPNHIEMPSKSYIDRLLKSHGWDILSSKPIPSENIPLPKDVIPLDLIPTADTAASINKLQVNREDSLPIQPVRDDFN